MANRRAMVKQAEQERALKAWAKVGHPAPMVRWYPDGRLELVPVEGVSTAEPNDWD